jgi:Eukaryotic aspartyl protease
MGWYRAWLSRPWPPQKGFAQGLHGVVQGLAFPALASTKGLPIFQNMISQGLLDQPLFAVWLSAVPDSTPAGAISFGAVNPARYTGPITYIPVNSAKYWWA